MAWLCTPWARESQIGGDPQFGEVCTKEPGREEQHLQAFDLAGVRVEARDDFV
jgi:hypothetical protein